MSIETEDDVIVNIPYPQPITTCFQVLPTTTLDEIYERLVIAVPTLRGTKFTFVCRDRPIFSEHWSCFNADFLLPEITIRTGTLEMVDDQQDPLLPEHAGVRVAGNTPAPKVLSNPNSPRNKTTVDPRFMTMPARTAKNMGLGMGMGLGTVTMGNSSGVSGITTSPPSSPKNTMPAPETHGIGTGNTGAVSKPVSRAKDITKAESRQLYGDVIAAIGTHRLREVSLTNTVDNSPTPTNANAKLDFVSGPKANAQSQQLQRSTVSSAESKTQGHSALQVATGGADTLVPKSRMSSVASPRNVLFGRCRYDFQSEKSNCLCFRQDEVIEILKKPADDKGWWFARNAAKEKGWVPAKYIVIMNDEDPDDADDEQAAPDNVKHENVQGLDHRASAVNNNQSLYY